MKFLRVSLLILLLSFLFTAFIFYIDFLGPGKSEEKMRFIVNQKTFSEEVVVENLVKEGFLKNKTIFNLILVFKGWHGKIGPGGYFISKSMNAYQLVKVLTAGPSEKWVVVPPGKRKEQVALILKKTLGWPEDRTLEFIRISKEGYLFPDTYLIEVDADAGRAVRIFKTNFDRYFDEGLQRELMSQNIRNETAIKIASLIERESGGDEDKPIIAGIIWNRLLSSMRLEIDATVQYAMATDLCNLQSPKPDIDNCNFWPWVPPGTVRKTPSLYNTYLQDGLPPAPISSPGLASIKAAIFPAQTDAFYYLHSPGKQIYTARTWKEHVSNIEKYLRNTK